MPVPRLFEAASEAREHWSHVVASLLALCGPSTRAALIGELAGEDLPGADGALVRERTRAGEMTIDVAAGDTERRWALAVLTSLAFEDDLSLRLGLVHDAIAAQAERAVVVALTPDRRPPEAVGAANDGRDVRHRSWLRVRDWVQERPERAGAEGVDLLLLREAEYFLTPRVAELYRLEGVMPSLPSAIRPALASAFFDLNELAPAPLIETGERGQRARIAFPRSGEPRAELGVEGGALRLGLAAPTGGPGFAAAAHEGWSVLPIAGPADYTVARGWVQDAARELLVGPR
jgi:hypothetical protein